MMGCARKVAVMYQPFASAKIDTCWIFLCRLFWCVYNNLKRCSVLAVEADDRTHGLGGGEFVMMKMFTMY